MMLLLTLRCRCLGWYKQQLCSAAWNTIYSSFIVILGIWRFLVFSFFQSFLHLLHGPSMSAFAAALKNYTCNSCGGCRVRGADADKQTRTNPPFVFSVFLSCHPLPSFVSFFPPFFPFFFFTHSAYIHFLHPNKGTRSIFSFLFTRTHTPYTTVTTIQKNE